MRGDSDAPASVSPPRGKGLSGKAVVGVEQIIKLGAGVSIDGYMVRTPDGWSFRYGLNYISTLMGYSRAYYLRVTKNGGKTLEALQGKGYTGDIVSMRWLSLTQMALGLVSLLLALAIGWLKDMRVFRSLLFVVGCASQMGGSPWNSLLARVLGCATSLSFRIADECNISRSSQPLARRVGAKRRGLTAQVSLHSCPSRGMRYYPRYRRLPK
jgi:hypothetical protein